MKLQLNEEVTNETKRCLEIVEKIFHKMKTYDYRDNLRSLTQEDLTKAIINIIKGSPYLEFNSNLLQKLSKYE